jgi:hypothetical protein
MPRRCQALRSSWKNSSRVSFLRSRPNHTGSAAFQIADHRQKFLFCPQMNLIHPHLPQRRLAPAGRLSLPIPEIDRPHRAFRQPQSSRHLPRRCALAGLTHGVLEPLAEGCSAAKVPSPLLHRSWSRMPVGSGGAEDTPLGGGVARRTLDGLAPHRCRRASFGIHRTEGGKPIGWWPCARSRSPRPRRSGREWRSPSHTSGSILRNTPIGCRDRLGRADRYGGGVLPATSGGRELDPRSP